MMTNAEFESLKQAAYQNGVNKTLAFKQAKAARGRNLWDLNLQFLATASMLGIPVGVLAGAGIQQSKSLGHESDLTNARVQYYHGLTNKLKDQLRMRGINPDPPKPEDEDE